MTIRFIISINDVLSRGIVEEGTNATKSATRVEMFVKSERSNTGFYKFREKIFEKLTFILTLVSAAFS